MTLTDISSAEWNQLTSSLELHHALFYQMWVMGRPFFDSSIPTAAVAFNREGDFTAFLFNPDFWQKLSIEERKFIICHECLHVLFQHGMRGIDSQDFDLSNVVMDVSVNHALVNNFGFDRSKLSIGPDLCWVDTVFPGQGLPDNESFEFYWNKRALATGAKSSIDDHSQLKSFDETASGKIVEKLNESLSNEEKQALASLGESVAQMLEIDIEKPVKKKKWETVIKEWSKKFRQQDDHSLEQWTRVARRYATLSTDLFLPTEIDHESLAEDRIQVWFFQDSSGSCVHLKSRFFKAARSLPKDRFDVKMHTFDTKVYEVSLDDTKIKGGGGTSFSIIETYIQNYIRKHKVEYPRAIFIITDGEGNWVKPQVPENWYWFLSTGNEYYIPEASSVYKLRDFE